MKRYVYLIRSQDNGYYKIGVSKNPQKRIEALQTGNSSKLKLINKFLTEYPTKIETSLHSRYSHTKKNGEWFDLTIEDELKFIDECKKIEKNINFLVENGNIFI
ncbi:MAG: GIY-YIG nuclease family protein [bacterium]